jgi:XTP/dITP diphosphohydrolase
VRDDAAASLRALNEVVERLRAPGGCPWDREQTHRTLSPYLLEEAHEALEAIDSGSDEHLREELGDVLLQVLMHSAIAAERGDGFDIGDVAEVTRAKMINRHPHVFADVSVSGPAEVVVNWERIKAGEKSARISLLEGVPRTLPGLAHAQGIQKRPARVGFDLTGTVEAARAEAQVALDRVAQVASSAPPAAPRGQDWVVTEGAVASGGDHPPPPPPPAAELEDAVGDLLFQVVSLSRRLRVNAEDALRRRTTVFADRFRRLEATARSEGVDLHALSPEEWRRRWGDAG